MSVGEFNRDEMHYAMNDQVVQFAYQKYNELVSEVPFMPQEIYRNFEIARSLANSFMVSSDRFYSPRWMLRFMCEFFRLREIPEMVQVMTDKSNELYA